MNTQTYTDRKDMTIAPAGTSCEKFGSISLIHGDCMDYLRTLPDNAFDLAIVDPPYGIGEDGSKNSSRGCLGRSKNYKPFAGRDKESPPREYFYLLLRVSQQQIIWGANHFISKLPVNSPCWVVWDKDNGATDFADCELAWTSFPTAVRKFKHKWQGMLQENMKNKEVRIHPTQKPVALYKWLLQSYAKPGDRILDTHLGSGSICIACHDLGFEMTGIELDPEYYAAGRQRLINHQMQGKLF